MSKKKYLRKNEFRYDTSPNVRRADGKGHMAYVSAKQGHRAKINIITHASSFHNEPTMKMVINPDRTSTYNKPSRFSVPRWENDTYLKEPNRGYWKISKQDRIAIKKFNKKYDKKK